MASEERQLKIDEVMRNRLRGVRFILEDVHDPHNAAAILRTADALGIGEVWYVFVEQKEYNPKKVGRESSSSANKWVNTPVFTNRDEVFARLKKEHVVSIATTIHEEGARELWDVDFSIENVAVWVGNEHRGLSREVIDASDIKLTIPMSGFVESLNVSVSAALVMGEIVRQRRSATV